MRIVIVGGGTSGQSEEKPAYSITHVFIPPPFRRKGNATLMMSLLHSYLSTAHSEPELEHGPAILFFLYSGVGTFYSRCGPPGWHIQSSRETYWTVSSILDGDVHHPTMMAGVPLRNLTLIRESDFAAVAQRDAALLRSEVKHPTTSAFAVLTTGDEFSWLVARSKFHGRILSSDRLPLQHWGVVTRTMQALLQPRWQAGRPSHTQCSSSTTRRRSFTSSESDAFQTSRGSSR